MPRRTILPLIIGLALMPAGAMAQIGAYADLAAIDNEVAQFTGKSIGQAGGAQLPVDRRLRLRGCGTPLMLSWRGPRHDTVTVECPDAGGWHVFVPVRVVETGAVAVMRGEGVTVTVVGDGFSVSQPGEALEGGAVGDWIRVRAQKDAQGRGDAMRARIMRPGEVEVPMP